MFHGGPPSVAASETLAIYAFMAASEDSKARGGAPVALADAIGEAVGRAQGIVEVEWLTPGTLAAAQAAGVWNGNAPSVAEFVESCGL
jgi:hypothetical protein